MTLIEKEKLRVDELRRYRILDSAREGTFDRITTLAANLLNVPHSCVSLIDADRNWFKSIVGFDVEEIPRSGGLCERTIKSGTLHHLADAIGDPEAASHPLVASEGGVRFYAGVPLVGGDGHAIGTLCVFGSEPRGLTEQEAAWLIQLGEFTMHEIEVRRMRLELEHTEGALLQAQRLGSIGLVASGVAHDFNNLLAGILGNVELLKLEIPCGSTARELVNEIGVVANRSAELVGQVLAHAGREGTEESQPVDFNALVRQTRYMLDSVVHENTLLEVKLYSDPVVVDGTPASLRQLVMNLITNASEAYEGEPGTVQLRTAIVEDQAVLTIEDQGKGLTPEARERMFEPLFTTKSTGRGLGLAVVKRIVDSPGVTIDVKSEPSEGTRVVVSLPLSAGSTSNELVGIREAPSGQGTILVIDDEQAILNVTRRILSRSDYEVLCALGGAEGIRLLKEHRDDVAAVILDMSMPVLSGVDTLVELRRVSSDLKVILSSGHTEDKARMKFSEHAIAGFLKKPYGFNELLDLVAATV